MSGPVSGFDLPHLPEEDRLRRILRSSLKHHLGEHRDQPVPTDHTFWDPAFLGLDRVKLFGDLNEAAQRAILTECARGLLEEAYFVEKAGVGYGAKMVLSAESTEERQLYGMIACEEATHLSQVGAYLPRRDPVGTDDAFLRFLGDLIESGPKTVLLLVVQVVLEGWGLTHYRRMAQGCRNPTLQGVLERILLDEARHHGSGVVLLESRTLSKAEEELAFEALTGFLGMVQAGPQRVVAALEETAGHFTREQKVGLFRELDTEGHSAERLETLKGLLGADVATGVVGRLVEAGAFTPLPPERCVP